MPRASAASDSGVTTPTMGSVGASLHADAAARRMHTPARVTVRQADTTLSRLNGTTSGSGVRERTMRRTIATTGAQRQMCLTFPCVAG